MKKLVLVLVLMVSSLCISQSVVKDSLIEQSNLKFIVQKKFMSKETVSLNYDLICLDKDGKRGFTITPTFSIKNQVVEYTGLTIKSIGMDEEIDSSFLTITFEDGIEKEIYSKHYYNKKGISYYDSMTLSELNENIKTIRLTNESNEGNIKDLCFYDLKPSEINYFLNINIMLLTQKYERI